MPTTTETVTIKLDDLMHLHKIIGVYEQALASIRIASSTHQASSMATIALTQDADKEDPSNVN